MATRRNVATATVQSATNNEPSQQGARSDIAPAVPAHVIYKLLGFTLAMFGGPIGSYFLTVDRIFGGNTTYAAAFAAIMVNVVVIGYVIVAMKEDQTEALEAAEAARKVL